MKELTPQEKNFEAHLLSEMRQVIREELAPKQPDPIPAPEPAPVAVVTPEPAPAPKTKYSWTYGKDKKSK